MTAKPESRFSAQLDPELVEMLEKFSLETSELNTPDQSESNITVDLVKDESDNFQKQLNIYLNEDENKILNNHNDLSSDKISEENVPSQTHTEKQTCVLKEEVEKSDACCSELGSLNSSNRNPKDLIDTRFDEKVLEDFENLTIIEENSDSEDEKDSDEITERGIDKQPKQDVRFHPIPSRNRQAINNVSSYKLPHNSSFMMNNNQFPQTNNIIDPPCMINSDNILSINSRHLDSSSTSRTAHFSELHNVDFDTLHTNKIQLSENKNTGHHSLYYNNIQISEKNKLPVTSSSLNPYSPYLQTGRINAFDNVETVQGKKSVQVPIDSRHLDFNAAEFRKDILSEDLTSKFLPVEEVENEFKNLAKTHMNMNSSSSISDLTENFKNLSSIDENTSVLPSHESSDFDNISLEIENKIKELYANSCLKGKPVKQPDVLKSVIHNQDQNSNHYSSRSKYRTVCCVLDTTAANELLSSPFFDHDKQKIEEDIINQEIQRGLYGTEDNKVIHLLKRTKKLKNKKTNLHEAVLNGNAEKAYTLVEIQKKHHGSVEGINIRDSLNNKTALDYANLKGMHLLAEYLRENLGYKSVIVEPQSPLSTIGV